MAGLMVPLAFAAPQREVIHLGEERQVVLGPRIGFSGQKWGTAGYEEEYHRELSDPLSAADAYDKLRIGNSTIASLIQRIEGPIRQAAWSVVHGSGAPLLPSVARMQADDEPDAGMEDEQARAAWLIESNLFGEPFPEYAMRQSWRNQSLHELCTVLAFPFAMFEAVPRWQSGALGDRVVLDQLNWLHPRSVAQVRSGEDGSFLGILQEGQHGWNDSTADSLSGGSQEIRRRFIPAHRLVVHARNREGDNPGGTPLVRHMFGDARRQEHAIKWQIIDAQNRAIGIPSIKLAKGATPKQLEDAKSVARRLTYGNKEQAYVVMEDGTEIGFVEMGANVANMDVLIQAQEARMRSVASAEVFALGQAGSEGSRAVASEFTPYFDLLVKSVADGIVEDIQRQVLEPLHRLNFGTSVPTPRLHVGNVSRPNVEQILAALTAQGVQSDGDVEQSLRGALDLPPLPDAEVARRNRQRGLPKLGGEGFGARSLVAVVKELLGSGAIDEDQAAELFSVITGDREWKDRAKGAIWSDPLRKDAQGQSVDAPPGVFAERANPVRLAAIGPGKPLLRALRREPTEHEAAFCCLADLDRGFEDIATDFVQAVKPLRAAAVEEAIRRMVVDGPRVTIPRLKSKPMREAIAAVMQKARDLGRVTAREELRAQVEAARDKRLATAPTFDPLAGRKPRAKLPKLQLAQEIDQSLDVVIGLRVESILNSVADAVRRSVLDSFERGIEGDEAADIARRELLDRSDAPLEAAGREVASRGVNNGRAEGVAESEDELASLGLEVDVARRSSVLDDATCPPCENLDHGKSGTEYEVGSDEYFSDMPPAHCDGRASCRCFFSFAVKRRTA